MKGFKERLRALEGTARTGWEVVHRIVVRRGQTEAEAFEAYGRDRIGERDLVIVRTIIAPGEAKHA